MNDGAGKLAWYVGKTDNSRTDMVSPTSYPTNQWVHVVITRNGNTHSLYENGVLKVQTSITNPKDLNLRAWFCGRERDTFGRFNGRQDETGFWTKALSDGGVSVGSTAGGEIADLYNGGAGLPYD